MGEALAGQGKQLEATQSLQMAILRNQGLTVMCPDVMEWKSNLALCCLQNAKASKMQSKQNFNVVRCWLEQAQAILGQIDQRSGLYPSERTCLEETQRLIDQK